MLHSSRVRRNKVSPSSIEFWRGLFRGKTYYLEGSGCRRVLSEISHILHQTKTETQTNARWWARFNPPGQQISHVLLNFLRTWVVGAVRKSYSTWDMSREPKSHSPPVRNLIRYSCNARIEIIKYPQFVTFHNLTCSYITTAYFTYFFEKIILVTFINYCNTIEKRSAICGPWGNVNGPQKYYKRVF